jgi:hypothetical protein
MVVEQLSLLRSLLLVAKLEKLVIFRLRTPFELEYRKCGLSNYLPLIINFEFLSVLKFSNVTADHVLLER